jgi:hypothetical protein
MRGDAGYKAATLSPAIKESLYGLFLKAVNSSNGHLRLAGIQCAKTIFPLNDVPSRLVWYETSSEGHLFLPFFRFFSGRNAMFPKAHMRNGIVVPFFLQHDRGG